MEETIVTKVTTHLEERAQRRKETYDKWTQDVFDPINDAVTKAVNKRVRRAVAVESPSASLARLTVSRVGSPPPRRALGRFSGTGARSTNAT